MGEGDGYNLINQSRPDGRCNRSHLDCVSPSDIIINMIKIYKTKTFQRWMGKMSLSDNLLLQAVNEMQQGLIDADLGDFLYKKRVALAGGGKRSGARTLIATKLSDRWFFLFGFAKNEKSNLSSQESSVLKAVGNGWLEASDDRLRKAVELKELFEVTNE